MNRISPAVLVMLITSAPAYAVDPPPQSFLQQSPGLNHPRDIDEWRKGDSPPYLHDGRLLTLDDVVEFFNIVLGTQLGADEKRDLIAYLRCL